MHNGRVIRGMVVATFVATALAIFPAQAFAEKTVGLSSGTFKYELDAGQTATGTIVVTNDGDEDISVLMYVSDQYVDEKGGITYKTPDRTDFSALTKPATWTRLRYSGGGRALGNIPYIELKPGERRAVSFAVDVPPSTAPGDHNMLIFFEMFDQPQGSGSKAVVSGRIGSRVTLRVNGTLVERLEVRPFEAPAFVVGNSVPFTFLVRNQGNTDRRVNADALLLNGSGGEVAVGQPISAELVFAQANNEASGTLAARGTAIGPHTLRVDVTPVDDAGNVLDAGKDRVTVERRVWLIPPWLIAAVGMFLVLLASGAAVRAYRRRSARGRQPERGSYDPADYEYERVDPDSTS